MKIQIVNDYAGDWVGLYVEGVLEFEGHSLSGSQLLEALKLPFERYEADAEQTGGCFPPRFEGIPAEAFVEPS